MSQNDLNRYFPIKLKKSLREFGIFLEDFSEFKYLDVSEFFALLNSYMPHPSGLSLILPYYLSVCGKDKEVQFYKSQYYIYFQGKSFMKKLYFYIINILFHISQKNNSQLFFINLLIHFRGARSFIQEIFSEFEILTIKKTFNLQYASIL